MAMFTSADTTALWTKSNHLIFFMIRSNDGSCFLSVIPINSTKHLIIYFAIYITSFISSTFLKLLWRVIFKSLLLYDPLGQYWSFSFFQNVLLENMHNIHSLYAGNGLRAKVQFLFPPSALLLRRTQCLGLFWHWL